MKINNVFKIILSIACVFLLVACKSTSYKEKETQIEEPVLNLDDNPKTLIVYFSQTGTTKQIATYIENALYADIYEIIPEISYSEEDLNYNNNSSRATVEQNTPTARPTISNSIENIEEYDTIILGYPIWHGQAPKIIYTFLESYDFSNKTILPFCTSHSSNVGSSATNLHSLTTNSTNWLEAKRFDASTTQSTINDWISAIK